MNHISADVQRASWSPPIDHITKGDVHVRVTTRGNRHRQGATARPNIGDMSPVGTPLARRPAVALRFRRDAASLTREQLALLRQAFGTLYGIKDDRGYLYFAGIHGLPLPISCGNAHGTPYFVPWHRAYLYLSLIHI